METPISYAVRETYMMVELEGKKLIEKQKEKNKMTRNNIIRKLGVQELLNQYGSTLNNSLVYLSYTSSDMITTCHRCMYVI